MVVRKNEFNEPTEEPTGENCVLDIVRASREGIKLTNLGCVSAGEGYITGLFSADRKVGCS